ERKRDDDLRKAGSVRAGSVFPVLERRGRSRKSGSHSGTSAQIDVVPREPAWRKGAGDFCSRRPCPSEVRGYAEPDPATVARQPLANRHVRGRYPVPAREMRLVVGVEQVLDTALEPDAAASQHLAEKPCDETSIAGFLIEAR